MRPVTRDTPPVKAPVLALPLLSVTAVPEPSSNPHAPLGPDCASTAVDVKTEKHNARTAGGKRLM